MNKNQDRENEMINEIIVRFHIDKDDITKKYVTDPLGDNYCLLLW